MLQSMRWKFGFALCFALSVSLPRAQSQEVTEAESSPVESGEAAPTSEDFAEQEFVWDAELKFVVGTMAVSYLKMALIAYSSEIPTLDRMYQPYEEEEKEEAVKRVLEERTHKLQVFQDLLRAMATGDDESVATLLEDEFLKSVVEDGEYRDLLYLSTLQGVGAEGRLTQDQKMRALDWLKNVPPEWVMRTIIQFLPVVNDHPEVNWKAAYELMVLLKEAKDPDFESWVDELLMKGLSQCADPKSCDLLVDYLEDVKDVAPESFLNDEYQAALATSFAEPGPAFQEIFMYMIDGLKVEAQFKLALGPDADVPGKTPRIDEADLMRLDGMLADLIENRDPLVREEFTDEWMERYWTLSAIGRKPSFPLGRGDKMIADRLIRKEKEKNKSDEADEANDSAEEASDEPQGETSDEQTEGAVDDGGLIILDTGMSHDPQPQAPPTPEEENAKSDLEILQEGFKHHLLRTQAANRGLRLYLARFTDKDPRRWYAFLRAAIRHGLYKQDVVDPVAGLYALLTSIDFEGLSPYRRELRGVLQQYRGVFELHRHPFVPPNAIRSSIDLLKDMDQKLDEFVTAQVYEPFFKPDKNPNPKKARVVDVKREQWMARQFPWFHSHAYQRARVTQSLSVLATLRERIIHEKAPLAKEEKFKELLATKGDHMVPFYEYICAGYYLPHTVDKPIAIKEGDVASLLAHLKQKPPFQKETIDPLSGEELDLNTVCGKRPDKVRNQVARYVTQTGANEGYERLADEASHRFLEMLLVWNASQFAGFFSRPTQLATKSGSMKTARHLISRLAGQKAVRTGVAMKVARTSAYFTARRFAPHFAQAFVGILAFATYQRTMLASLGMAPLYDPSPEAGGIIGNYSGEIATGGAIFFFAPIVQKVFRGVGARWAGFGRRAPAGRRLAARMRANFYEKNLEKAMQANVAFSKGQERILYWSHVAGDTFVFWTIPYGDRAARSLVMERHDAIWQGGEEFIKDGVSAFTFGLMFSTLGGRSMRIARENEQMRAELVETKENWGDKDPYKILGLEPGATPTEVQKRYRKLASLNHPDRFEGRPKEQERAKEENKKITEARDMLAEAEGGGTEYARIQKLREKYLTVSRGEWGRFQWNMRVLYERWKTGQRDVDVKPKGPDGQDLPGLPEPRRGLEYNPQAGTDGAAEGVDPG